MGVLDIAWFIVKVFLALWLIAAIVGAVTLAAKGTVALTSALFRAARQGIVFILFCIVSLYEDWVVAGKFLYRFNKVFRPHLIRS